MAPDVLADVHARAFAGSGRAWKATEFEALLRSELVFVTGGVHAFAMGRAVAGEAELLTLACASDQLRKGLGRCALRAFEAEARRRAAERLFLEVAADNSAALSLYRSEGYVEISRRAAYYARHEGPHVDAITMEKIPG